MNCFARIRVASVATSARRADGIDGQRRRQAWWLPAGLLVAGALLLCASTRADDETPVPAAAGYVVDTTGSVSTADRERLVGLARQINQSTGAQLFTVIVDHTDPEPIENFAQRVFTTWKPGRKGADDGLVLVLAPNNKQRKTRLQVGYGLEGAIPDATARRILGEQVRPALDQGGATAQPRRQHRRSRRR